MNVLDLFSGIGGFSLGLERAGMTAVAFCEIDPFCRQVLKKHWPLIPIYDDVRELTGEKLRQDGIKIDLICGGFPCQDISIAGNGTGLKGERSGLWNEYRRLIEEIRPKFVIIENVALLRSRGLETILGQLHALGYDAEWHCISASAVGAPHIRDRLWIIAYSGSARFSVRGAVAKGTNGFFSGRSVAPSAWWSIEPGVVRVVHGVPNRVDRIRSLGNAVVPQIVEQIGRVLNEK